MTETCSPGTGHPVEGPDKPGSIGLMPARGRNGRGVTGGFQEDFAAGRGRRDPHQGAERHQRLLEPAKETAEGSSATVS